MTNYKHGSKIRFAFKIKDHLQVYSSGMGNSPFDIGRKIFFVMLVRVIFVCLG